MSVSIHPHKGYLNTKFNLHVTDYGLNYNILKNGSDFIESATVLPNIPHEVIFSEAGEYCISFENGEEIKVEVEDGYKFGGSKYKKAFIFDDCPWCFVVMYDRTYFYNRDTKRYFMEIISPDNIRPIGKEYILIENEGQAEQTVFSLIEEKPILNISNVIAYSDDAVAWIETIDKQMKLCVCSFNDETRGIERLKIDGYYVDEKNKVVLCYYDTAIYRVSLVGYTGSEECTYHANKKIVGVSTPNFAFVYACHIEQLEVYNVDNGELIHSMSLNGKLAEFNSNKLINIIERQNAFEKLKAITAEIPELNASAVYCRVFTYPCEWDLFYTVQTIRLSKNGSSCIVRAEDSSLYSVNTDINIAIKKPEGEFYSFYNAFCFFNNKECFIKSRHYNNRSYIEGGTVYVQKERIYLYKNNILYTLSKNGFWDNSLEIKLDFSKFSQYGVVEDLETNTLKTLSNNDLDKLRAISYINEPYLRTEKYIVFSGCRVISSANIGHIPTSLTKSLNYGLRITDGGVLLFTRDGDTFQETSILEELYDNSSYKDVLLSEDGNYILHRDADITIVKNIRDNSEQKYDNLSYISHINGIRPLVNNPASLQPRLVNPITGQYIDFKKMTKYKFISPDEKLYADTRLKEYEEHYYKENNQIISLEEYENLVRKYTYPWQETVGSDAWKEVAEARTKLVIEHFDYLNAKYSSLLNNDRTGTKWKKDLIDVIESNDTKFFLSYLIGVRGIAVIRNTKDDSVFTKIDLGAPLQFMNYVSFSYDSKYVAIAGCRINGGLLLVYDLMEQKAIIHESTNKAVWNVVFSRNNSFASYTSTPDTFFSENESKLNYEKFDDRLILGNNFLTFSPDGELFALSKQGYISKFDFNGNERDNWGHQPSSVVEVRKTSNADSVNFCFTDLSDDGIEDTYKNKSVASVSFSNDNSKLMMVGNDGVVVIRNLK